MTTDTKAIWACATCKTERQWGTAKPTDPQQVGIIRCETCKSTTAHYFVQLFHSYSTFDLPRALPLVRPSIALAWNGGNIVR